MQGHYFASARNPPVLGRRNAVMPSIDGYTLAEWLRKDPELAAPVILMSETCGQGGLLCRCADSGAACMPKPASQSDLWTAVAKVMGLEGRSVGGATEAAAPRTAPSRTLQVLLAEDNPANQKVVLYVLGKRGHVVQVAPNGQRALDLIGQRDFDAVLMDVQMPVLDGLETTKAIRQLGNPKKARVPIIAMTAHALKGDAQRCLAAGMDAYLSKPIKAPELIELVERLTAEAEGREGQTQSEPTGTKEHEPLEHEIGEGKSTEVFNREEGLRRCFGRHEVFAEMVRCFFAETDDLLRQMHAALDREDWADVSQIAHRLKGTVVHLGAELAADATRRVEQMARSGDVSQLAEAIEDLERQLGLLKNAVARSGTHHGNNDQQAPRPQRNN